MSFSARHVQIPFKAASVRRAWPAAKMWPAGMGRWPGGFHPDPQAGTPYPLGAGPGGGSADPRTEDVGSRGDLLGVADVTSRLVRPA